jgi:voltage-gated potassium channel
VGHLPAEPRRLTHTGRSDDRARRVERIFEIPVLIAAALVIPVVIIEATSSLHEPWRSIAGTVNWIIWLVFAAELVAHLALVQNRWRWLRHHPLEVVVVILTPPFLPASLQTIRVLRLLRLLRLFRLAQIGRRLFSLEGLRYVSVIAFLTVIGGGAAFAAVEKGRYSTWDGMWWSITTITTVGYGDVYPHTTAGRLIAVIVAVIGIGFVAILTGAVAQRFLAPAMAATEEHVAEEAASVDAILSELRGVMKRLAEIEDDIERLPQRAVF